MCDPQHIHIRLSGQFKNTDSWTQTFRILRGGGAKNSAFLTNSSDNSHLQSLRPAGLIQGFPDSSDGKESACNAGDLGSTQVALVVKKLACQYRRHKRCRFNPWGGKSPWRRKWQLTPVFLPGESHGIEKAGRLQSTGLQRVGHD